MTTNMINTVSRLRTLWQGLRRTVAEMNYAARRLVELQAAPLAGGHAD
jgi:hypothetical protein